MTEGKGSHLRRLALEVVDILGKITKSIEVEFGFQIAPVVMFYAKIRALRLSLMEEERRKWKKKRKK